MAETPAMNHTFTKGSVYRSRTHGWMEFIGVDWYMGEMTLRFKGSGGDQYWRPESISEHFDVVSP